MIPRCMSTQHPDNVRTPFFAHNSQLSGDDEIKEAYYAFSHLGCDEQMWDCEGKETDVYVVKKLLTQHPEFFKDHPLGEEIRLTLRVPNPQVERAEAKVLLETLESIPRSYDAAKLFYKKDQAPIFEVILPMAESAQALNRVFHYYSDFISAKQDQTVDDVKIADWIGEFHPKNVNVIPLFEDKVHMLEAANITGQYLNGKNPDYQRVFLARSDPALNFGSVNAVLLNKIALHDLHHLGKDRGIPIHPIIGAGSAPFRGNLGPLTAKRVAEEYPSTQTFSIQSAFKYDFEPEVVCKGVQDLKDYTLSSPHEVNRDELLPIIEKLSVAYKRQVHSLAPLINKVARFVPSRRKRKLHVGLFGYAREMDGVQLPRAIKFTAALYSLGLPPEILGMNVLDDSDIQTIKKHYVHFDHDLKDAYRYYADSSIVPEEIKAWTPPVDCEAHNEHQQITKSIVESVQKNDTEKISDAIVRAAHIRKFLG